MTRGDRIDNLPIDRIFTYGTTATARQIQMQSFDVISNFGTLRYRSGGTARHHANSNIPSKFRFCILGVNFIVCRRSLLLLLLHRSFFSQGGRPFTRNFYFFCLRSSSLGERKKEKTNSTFLVEAILLQGPRL